MKVQFYEVIKLIKEFKVRIYYGGKNQLSSIHCITAVNKKQAEYFSRCICRELEELENGWALKGAQFEFVE